MARQIKANRRELSIKQKIDEIVPKYISAYLCWKLDDNPNKRTFEDLQKTDTHHYPSEEHCEGWLTREDVQQAMQIYLQQVNKLNLIKIYNVMLEKALNGDVKSAQWIESFSKSKFFEEEKSDEIDNFLDGVNIPALNGGDN